MPKRPTGNVVRRKFAVRVETIYRCLDHGIWRKADSHRETCPKCGRRFVESTLERRVLE
jgi:hypothetical protein